MVCGEALIDLVSDPSEKGDTFSTPWSALSAGGPMNTAVGLAKLGATSRFLGRLSSDAFGRQLRGHLEAAEVGLELAVSSAQATSLAVVDLDDSGKASYTFHFDRTANFSWQRDELPALGEHDWFHAGSLALIVPPGAEVLLDWAAGLRCPVSLDLNVRSAVVGDPEEYWRRLEPWLQVVGDQGVIKASDEDVEFLAQAPALASGRWQQVAEQWMATYRVGTIVITRGEGGASALDSEGRWTEVPGFPTEVVDTVGAGDTFMAGFLDGFVRRGNDLEGSLCRGAAAASIVCSRQGAQPPTADEVEALISRDVR